MIACGIYTTRVGITRDVEVNLNWGDPGAPLLPAQVLLAFLAVGMVILLSSFMRKISLGKSTQGGSLYKFRYFDLIVFLLLWASSTYLWLAPPAHATYFSPAARPPNYEYYPYSDAADYDMSAQYLLAGKSFPGVAKRPLYSLFLAGLHVLGHGNYQTVIILQVVLLALIPAVLYLTTAVLDFRTAGIIAALLFSLREMNAVALSGVANLSHARMLMTDMPTTLGVALLGLLMALWLRYPQRRRIFALLSGGVIGLWMLIRVQVFVLIPAGIILSLIVYRKPARLWLRDVLLFGVGVCLAVSPWLLRNWQLTGQPVIESSSQLDTLAGRYSDSPLAMDENSVVQNSFGSVFQYIIQKPARVFSFTAEHFMHNLVTSVFALPVSFRLVDDANEFYNKWPYWHQAGLAPQKLYEQCCSLVPYVKEDVPYWMGWNGILLPGSILPVLLTLFLVAAGMATSYRRWGGLALIPLGLYIGYDLSDALIRSSGWRFILPVDWVIQLYFALGLVFVIKWIVAFFLPQIVVWESSAPEARIVSPDNSPSGKVAWRPLWAAACALLLIGMLLPLSERIFPDRYTSEKKERLLESLSDDELSQIGLDKATLERFLSSWSGQAIYGRTLAPKFFSAGENEPWYGNWDGRRTRAGDEMDFMLIGSASTPALLPLQGKETSLSPSTLPHASSVIALGCPRSGFFEVKALFILDNPKHTILQSPVPVWNCNNEY